MSSDGILGLGGRMAKLEHAEAHRVVGRRHFERHAAVQARPDARLERFQLRRRTVGRDHDLLGAVEQHVDQMAELMLDRFALQELHVVDDQKVDVAQLLLQRQRIVVADGGGEAPHEIFGRQIDDAGLRVLLQRFRCDRLQQVRFSEPDRRMQEKRVEPRHGFGDRARRGKRHAVRRAFDEGLERIALVERRSEHALAEFCRRSRRSAAPAPVPRGHWRWCPSQGPSVRGGRLACRLRLVLGRGPRVPGGGARDDLDLAVGFLLAPQLGDQVEIMAVDPGFQESCRN